MTTNGIVWAANGGIVSCLKKGQVEELIDTSKFSGQKWDTIFFEGRTILAWCGRLIGKRGSRRAANKSTTVMMQIMLSLMVQPVIENQERYLAKLRFVYVRVPLIPRVPLRRTSQLRWKDNFHIANQRVENLEKSIYLHWDSTWILTYKIAQSNKRLTTKPLRLLQKMWLTPTYLEGL